MRKVASYSNWDAADTANLDGKARNKAGAIAGTLWTEELLGDIIETFLKGARDGGLDNASRNNLPDNEDNTYQLYDAFKNAMNSGAWTEVAIFDGDNSQSGAPYNPLHVRKKGDVVEITGAYSNLTGDGFTLPAGFYPANAAVVICALSTAPGVARTANISSSGVVTMPGGASVGTYIFSASFCVTDLS